MSKSINGKITSTQQFEADLLSTTTFLMFCRPDVLSHCILNRISRAIIENLGVYRYSTPLRHSLSADSFGTSCQKTATRLCHAEESPNYDRAYVLIWHSSFILDDFKSHSATSTLRYDVGQQLHLPKLPSLFQQLPQQRLFHRLSTSQLTSPNILLVRHRHTLKRDTFCNARRDMQRQCNSLQQSHVLSRQPDP